MKQSVIPHGETSYGQERLADAETPAGFGASGCVEDCGSVPKQSATVTWLCL